MMEKKILKKVEKSQTLTSDIKTKTEVAVDSDLLKDKDDLIFSERLTERDTGCLFLF